MPNIRYPLLLLTALLYSHAGYALDGSTFVAPGAEGQFVIERYHRDIISQNVVGELRTVRLRINAYESPYSWVQGGLHLGYLDISHDDTMLTNGLSPSGEFFGITLRSPRPSKAALAPHWSLAYTYNNSDASDTTYHTEISWHDYQAELGLLAHYKMLSVMAAGYFANLEGEANSRESIPPAATSYQSQRFSAAETSGAMLTINYQTHRHGYIGLTVKAGALQGAAITFANEF